MCLFQAGRQAHTDIKVFELELTRDSQKEEGRGKDSEERGVKTVCQGDSAEDKAG